VAGGEARWFKSSSHRLSKNPLVLRVLAFIISQKKKHFKTSLDAFFTVFYEREHLSNNGKPSISFAQITFLLL
jgi:hypothetical protein